MPEALEDQIIEKIKQATEKYYQLLLVVAPAGAGKTALLQKVCDRIGTRLINVNLELSRRMLELTEHQRALQLPELLKNIVNNVANKVVLLDNLEILFDLSLKNDPLRLLQKLSRNKTVIAAWNGSIVNGYLTYAVPDHPEYRRYPVNPDDFLVIHLKEAT